MNIKWIPFLLFMAVSFAVNAWAEQCKEKQMWDASQGRCIDNNEGPSAGNRAASPVSATSSPSTGSY